MSIFIKKILLSLLILSSLKSNYYNGVIKCFIKPSTLDLENKLQQMANGVEEFDKDALPVINYQNETIKNSGDGLSIFKKSNIGKDNEQYSIARKILNRSLMGVDGVFAYYRGFATLSDSSGLIMFPRLEPEHELIIVITKEIIPVVTRGQIPIGFRPLDFEESKIFKLLANPIAGGLMFEWVIEEISFEENKEIPFNALIIVCDPKEVYFDDEPNTFLYSENIMIPTLFAQHNFTKGIYGMNALDTLQFFKPLSYINKESILQKNIHFGTRFIDTDTFDALDQ